MYKAIGVDANKNQKSEIRRPEIRSKVIECKNEKICTTVKQLYLFICRHISFQAKFCLLIVICLKNIEKMFFITKCSYVDFKMGSKVIKCNNWSILTNCVSFFSLVQRQDAF